jgi:hypothetical protein
MTAAERLLYLAGTDGSAGSLLMMLASGSTSGEILVNYSGIESTTASDHLLYERVASVVGGGGYTYPLDARRSPRVAPHVETVIKKLAKKQVSAKKTSKKDREDEYEQQLITELAKLDLQYQVFYLEVLEEERDRLLTSEIKRLIEAKQKQDDEYEAIALLMLMM